MSDENTHQQESTETIIHPLQEIGQLLKAARERRGLTLDELSSATRLNIKILTALEEYQPEQLPPMAFVLGYIRSYAKHVDVDMATLHIEGLETETKAPVVKSSLVGPPESSSRDLSVRMISYLIIISALVLLVSWWVSQKDQVKDAATVNNNENTNPVIVTNKDGQNEQSLALPKQNVEITTDENITEAVTETIPSEPAITTSVETAITTSVETEITKPVEEKIITPVEAEITDPVENTAQKVVIDETSQVELIEITEGNVQSAQEQAQTTTNNDDKELPADTLQSLMELSYSTDCWSEISDSTGRRLVFGLIKEGRVITIKGVAPFSVFLGFAKGVSIKINDEPYNNRQLTRNGIARFKAGFESGNRILNQ